VLNLEASDRGLVEVMSVRIKSEIRIRNLLNTSPERVRYTNPFVAAFIRSL